MKLWKLGVAALAIPMFGFIHSEPAHACAAMGQPKITIKLEKDGTGRALISEYNCAHMVRKTHCVVGVRLSDNAPDNIAIGIRSLRFVSLKDGSPLKGFAPLPNQRATAAWGRVMDGTWYGFTAVFGAQTEGEGGLAIEATFSYDPNVRPEEIVRSFDYGHVGLAEGDSHGGIAHGHMMEVVQIQGATLAQ
ncbi:MAG TPA: hypothetical protein VEI03_23795 [Stellaceae bacterium]|nr:hypothetical protein [Stellaceae bacterium]